MATITKKDLARSVADTLGCKNNLTLQMVDSLFETMRETLIEGNRIEIRGFRRPRSQRHQAQARSPQPAHRRGRVRARSSQDALQTGQTAQRSPTRHPLRRRPSRARPRRLLAPLTSLEIRPTTLKAGSLRVGFYCICVGLALLASGVRAEQRLHIGADPRIELLTAVQLLSQYRYLTPYRVEYADDLITHFSRYPPQQAVAFFRSLSLDTGWSDAYPTAMLYLSDPPALELTQPIPPSYLSRLPRRGKLRALRPRLAHLCPPDPIQPLLHPQPKALSAPRDSLPRRARRCRSRRPSRGLFRHPPTQLPPHPQPAPCTTAGLARTSAAMGGRTMSIHYSAPPTPRAAYPNTAPAIISCRLYGTSSATPSSTPLSEEYYPVLRPQAELFAPLAEQMARIGYTHWFDCANEHLIRGHHRPPCPPPPRRRSRAPGATRRIRARLPLYPRHRPPPRRV